MAKLCANGDSSNIKSSTPHLTMADLYMVTKMLRDLDNDQLIGVGVALGLYRPNLKRMKDLLGDMVAAWLREDDSVTVASGSPSWDSLAAALEDIGHKGIASKIRKGPLQGTQIPSPELSSAFSRYRIYLKSYYNINSVACDDKLFIAPCSEFINLALVKKDSVSKDDTFSQSTLYGGRDQISAHKVPLDFDAILTSESKFVLVEGAPGIGKSTLSWELCRKWDTLKSLQHCSIVLLLKLREGRIQNASSLNELFYHRDRALCESVVSEVLRCEGEGVLLILDGFDEMPASTIRNKESLIMEIISGSCIPRATCLVTSRPSALHHTKYFPREFRHVEIVGFTDESKEKFAKIAFKSEPHVLSEFKKFIFSNPIIKSLMYIPVNCAILAQSFKDIMRSGKQAPQTTTQLYTMLTRILIRRHLIAIGRWDEDAKVPSNLRDLSEDVCRDLKRVSKLAFTGLLKEDIQLVFTDSDVGEGFHPLGLLSEVKEMYVCEGARSSYSFLHLSIQEYLAAWHISCHQELVKEALAKTLCDGSPHLHVFGRILAGIIGISDLYVKYLMEWYNSYPSSDVELYTCHCFYEAQNSMSGNIFNKIIPLSPNEYPIRLLTPLDMYVFGYCLAYVPHRWQFVNFESSVDMLVCSLADHASGNRILGSIDSFCLVVDACLSSSFKFMDLPQRLRGSIKELSIEDEHSYSSYQFIGEDSFGLSCFKIWIGEDEPEPFLYDHLLEDIILSSQLCNLRELKVWAKLTESSVCLLNKVLTCNSTIEEIELNPSCVDHSDYEYRMDSLAQAALACPSLKSLTTFFPFVTSDHTSPRNLQSIILCHDTKMVNLPRFIDCLCSIANVCKVSRLQSFDCSMQANTVVSLSLLPRDLAVDYYDCISLFNVYLHHHWPFMKELELPFSIPSNQFHLSSLTHALGRNPDAMLSKLKRSKSLSELACLRTLINMHGGKHMSVMPYSCTPVRKSESCPDLVGIKSLHPLMAKQLFHQKSFPNISP